MDGYQSRILLPKILIFKVNGQKNNENSIEKICWKIKRKLKLFFN